MRGFFGFQSLLKSRDSSVSTVTTLGAGVSGVRTLADGKRFFSYPERPDRLWSSSSLLYNGHRGVFHSWVSGWSVRLTTHLRIVPRLRISTAIPPHPCMSSWRTQRQLLHFLIRQWQFLTLY